MVPCLDLMNRKPESERAARLQGLLKVLRATMANREDIRLTATRARLELKYGITAKTAASYLQTLVDAGYIVLNEEEDHIEVV